MSFDALLSRIAGGESVPSSELLPYLGLEQRAQRAHVNTLLAESYFQSGREADLRHARVFIRRAWLLSEFSPDLLPLYTRIHAALDDIAGIREAYKRLGMAAAARGDVSETLGYFDSWQYAYMQFKSLDQYEYDLDVLEAVDRLARPHRLAPRPRAGLLKDGKVRVAYLVKGVTEVGSVLVKLNLLFARHHDRARIEPLFFAPEAGREVFESAAGREHVRLFEGYGCKLVTAPDMSVPGERLRAVARTIHEARPDLLVASAALAQFQHYYITALRPAPFVVGLVQGPPPQFAAPSLDWGLAWTKHPQMDSPVSCSPINIEVELPERESLVPYTGHDLGIPDGALVIGTAGRHAKFQEPEFWKAVIDLLHEHPGLYYLAMGADESQVPFLSDIVSPEVRRRIRFLGWRGDDYLRGLCLTDVLIDTFPSGGGVILFDAMALGVPVVAFKNDYMKLYDQTDWSPAEELMPTETVVERGDFAQMKRAVTRLLEDRQYRRDTGRRLQEHVRQTRGDPARMVRSCEEVYLRFLERKLSGEAATDPREAEVEGSARASAPRRAAPLWVARTAHQLKRALRFGVRALDRIA